MSILHNAVPVSKHDTVSPVQLLSCHLWRQDMDHKVISMFKILVRSEDHILHMGLVLYQLSRDKTHATVRAACTWVVTSCLFGKSELLALAFSPHATQNKRSTAELSMVAAT